MIYVGVHKIEWGKVYYHSSKNEVFNKLREYMNQF